MVICEDGDASDRNRQQTVVIVCFVHIQLYVRSVINWILVCIFVFFLFSSLSIASVVVMTHHFIIRWGVLWCLTNLKACSFTSSAREWCDYWRTAGSTSVTGRTTSISACDSSGSQVTNNLKLYLLTYLLLRLSVQLSLCHEYCVYSINQLPTRRLGFYVYHYSSETRDESLFQCVQKKKKKFLKLD